MNQTLKNPEEQLCDEGDAFLEVSNNEEALKCFNHALGLNPDCTEAHLGKIRALYLLGRLDEGLDCCEKVIEFEPENGGVYTRKALIFDSMGRFDEGLECIDKAISIDPNCSSAYINQSVILQHLGRNDEAMESLDKAINADPKEYLGYYNKAQQYSRMRKYEEALKNIESACSLTSNCIFECLRGRCLQVLGKQEESHKAFATAKELIVSGKPGEGLSADNIAFVEKYLKED